MQKKVIKTIFLFALAFFHTTAIQAQNYMITFTGSDQSNVVDTVEVKNTTQQTSVTLNGSDTLYLADVIGIKPNFTANAGMLVYPNPTTYSSRVEFYNAEAGNVSLEISDINGKLMNSITLNLSLGMHAFMIHDIGAGINLLKLRTATEVFVKLIISSSQGTLHPCFNYLGNISQAPEAAPLKSTKNIVEMQYNEGERLVFKASSGNYAHTKNLVPTQSQNIDFEFIDCIDGDNNRYGVVTIGEQVWMAENLKYLPSVVGPTSGSLTVPRYYVWGYWGTDVNAAKATTAYQNYGALYNWPASLTACPQSWHLPSNAEWGQLTYFLASQGFPNNDVANGAGNALKSCRQKNSPLGGDCNTSVYPRWNENSTHHGFDEFSFSALSGGTRHIEGTFGFHGYNGFWWSATQSSSTWAFARSMFDITGYVSGGGTGERTNNGYSVRCVRDID